MLVPGPDSVLNSLEVVVSAAPTILARTESKYVERFCSRSCYDLIRSSQKTLKSLSLLVTEEIATSLVECFRNKAFKWNLNLTSFHFDWKWKNPQSPPFRTLVKDTFDPWLVGFIGSQKGLKSLRVPPLSRTFAAQNERLLKALPPG
jgi:hypothetical protein